MIKNSLIKQEVERGMQDAKKTLLVFDPWFVEPWNAKNRTVENEADFILGAVLCQAVNNIDRNLIGKHIKPTQEEFNQIHQFIFSQAPTLKKNIKKVFGV